MGGTLTKSHRVVAAASTPAPGGWKERGGDRMGGLPSTLLGPEATGRLSCGRVADVSGGHGSPGRTQTSRLAGAGVYGSPEWVRPLLENCIVDASIFEFFQDCSACQDMLSWFLLIVVLPKVFKGTLVDALALGAEEGRCSLR